jgi:putative serine protease PepD
LKAGDVITAVGGRAVDQPSQVVEAVRALQPGASVEIKIVRDKKEMTVKAAIGERVRAYRLLRDAGRSVRL